LYIDLLRWLPRFQKAYREIEIAKERESWPRWKAEFTSSVPLLPRDTVKDQPLAFISEKATNGSWQRTGGSTGKPLDIYWGHDAHLEMLRAKYRFCNLF